MALLQSIGDGLWNAFQMAWEVWWALVLGFLLSAIVQAWVPKSRMQRALGDAGPKQIALATGLGGARAWERRLGGSLAARAPDVGARLVGRRAQLPRRRRDALEGDHRRLRHR